MKLKSIEWRNIGPYGNKLQKLELSDSGGLWMVLGKNGNGKSFVVNLPKILYYGRLDGFKKDEMANRLNKHGWIKGEIETSPGVHVMIERNIAPSDLIVHKYKRGEEATEENDIGKSGIKNYQDYIDLEVTGLPYNIFSNIISLSVNDFKSFISMSPNDKRIIIDKLFAMEIINKMNDLIRKDLREIKINLDLYDREIMSLNSSIQIAVKELERARTRVEADNTKRIIDLIKKMKSYQPKMVEAQEKLKTYQDKKAEIKKAKEEYQNQKRGLESEINGLKSKIDLYNQDKCPTCETPFSEKRFSLLKESLSESFSKKQTSYEALGPSGEKYDVALGKVNEAINKLNDYILQIKTAFNTLNNEVEKLKKEKPAEFSSMENIISKNTISVKKKEEEKVETDDNHKYLSILEDLYSDSGVKKKIMESYLPTLNKEIEFTLGELHFPYSLKFNSQFEPKLEHLGIDINVETLSTGEKKRVDLAVLISIIRMLKRKYPALNIFMLDEVLSSIDGDGIYDIIGLLQRTAKELRMNIFIINHSPLPIEHFSYKIEITKNAGFSDLTVEKLDDEEEN
jgi:DNA repair exonuclease SbcCD ATPase subunit